MLLFGALGSPLAVEGMWEPTQLDAHRAQLQQAGFTGDAAALARLDTPPLAAVVRVNGCTASFVASDGLLLTNHHCVTDFLAQAQREGENLVDTGFYAKTRADERSVGPGGRMWLTTKIEDVTDRINGKTPKGIKDLDRALLIEKRIKDVVAACEAPAGVRCRVSSVYEGSSYTLATQLELRDLRLVYAPPDSVGNYGDEVDNWHWPRHAGEFAFVRAYTGADGTPADFAATNIPFRPSAVLKIASRGPRPGEFVMVAGYPRATERWRTAAEVSRAQIFDLPTEIAELEAVLGVYADVAKADPAAGAVLEPARLDVANDHHNAIGTLEGYRRSGVVARADARDHALRDWIASTPAREKKYGPAMAELAELVARRDATRERDVALRHLSGASDLVGAAETIYEWSLQRQRPDAQRELGYQDRDASRVRAELAEVQKGLQLEADRRLVLHYLRKLGTESQVRAWLAAATPEAAVTRLYTDPPMAGEAYRIGLLDASPDTLEASKDPFLQLAVALHPLRVQQRADAKADLGAFARTRPLYVAAMRAFDEKRAWPDANGTLRLSFGSVKGYEPRDGVFHTPHTTLEGVAAKAGAWPFDAPAELLSAIAGQKHGPYRDDTLGSVPVNFLSDLDITGGNSGSPTLNQNGELVGLAFDSNYEGIASDWLYDAPYTRCIHVDVRYMLFYLDAVAEADALLRELGVEPAL